MGPGYSSLMTIPVPPVSTVTCHIPVETLSDILLNKSGKIPLPERFRALFTLKGLNNDEAVKIIGQAFNDPSALLKHELAYVLGQMRLESANSILTEILCNLDEEPIVRHEAAEALGAIGSIESVPLLKRFLNDESQPVRETCEIAINLILNPEQVEEPIETSPSNELQFSSVDPAPALKTKRTIPQLQTQLMDRSLDLYHRYKAMFTLRNRGTDEAVLAICTGFSDESALFRHEIAYVLGQLQNPVSIPALSKQLRDTSEMGMVRHECAEALGSIASEECLMILREFENDPEDVVRESCLVARDMYEYENSDQLHFYPVND